MSRSKRDGTESRDGFKEMINEIEIVFDKFLILAKKQEQRNTINTGIDARRISADITKRMLAFRLKSQIYTPNNRNQNPELRTRKRANPQKPPGRKKKVVD